MIINHNEKGKLTMRHFQSSSLISPGVWRMEKSASPEVLGCRLNSFPASGVNINTSCIKRQLDHSSKTWIVSSGTNLSFCLKSVGVQAVNVIEDHVVIQRYIGTVSARGNITRINEIHVQFMPILTLYYVTLLLQSTACKLTLMLFWKPQLHKQLVIKNRKKTVISCLTSLFTES